jgi:hypothetical protein
LRFLQPQIPRWSITPWSSFESAVAQIIQVRQANPLISANNGLSTDPTQVSEELDAYNARICAEMKWNDFIWEGGPGQAPPPKFLSPLKNLSGQLAVGVKTLVEWEISGGNLVEQSLAETRAKTCSTCPNNGSGDLSSWFTIPAAALIQKQLEARNNLKIQTNFDPLLGVCSACACPLRLKVHAPLDIILDKIRPEDKAKLVPQCWILQETK